MNSNHFEVFIKLLILFLKTKILVKILKSNSLEF